MPKRKKNSSIKRKGINWKRNKKMKDLGKGIGIAACAISIAVAAIYLQNANCLFAFILVVWMVSVWND